MKTNRARRGALSRLVERLRGDARGNVAMIFALGLPALLMLTGMGVDLYRADVARNTSQQAVDAAALAAAASRERTQAGLARVAADYMKGNIDLRYLDMRPEPETRFIDDIEVEVTMRGTVRTLFMGVIGVAEMPVNVTATAIRGAAEEVELALVLDNTWSMSVSDARGVTRINALKSASTTLVNELMQRDGARVKIGIVPYADYVNVGTSNFGQPWLKVTAMTEVTETPQACRWTNKTLQTCTPGVKRWEVCSETKDGVTRTWDCEKEYGRTCTTVDLPEAQWKWTCPAPTITTKRWYGCVASRHQGMLRLNDSQPEMKYEGLMQTSQTCLNPILPLTNQKAVILSAVQGLIVNRGSYQPETYIPAGMIWGVNVLSPTAPFTEGGAYHVANRDPRKIMVLMTDGANTLRFVPGSGMHGSATAAQVATTNSDTQAICTYAKSNKIEVFTVALAVESATARQMLEDCASSRDHYFDASDSAALTDAFQEIAASINKVRLIN
ncbi:VWA domain-containing protein [Brevundimonas sp. S30B]|uniref:pilus assembly protein TadG-related protein n=1 Tax=unclassified Brevundimonas TaxID=2622653 RepID=UPI001072A30D|nr:MULTISPECIES: pilus assembly protein TadG-related protein [unclassified Brevundimonas]QBX37623.1 VWA domain-containing protein [Brevundimonas sp. MF30-B]TFW03584.1 VWA domain-containing protein [Brevundimonas sp. S30B]